MNCGAIVIKSLCCVVTMATGCAAGQKNYRRPVLSPDGARCAYLITDWVNFGIGPEPSGLGGGHTRVEWLTLANPSSKSGLTISKYTGKQPRNGHDKEIAFSPDSKFIGVLDRQQLHYINLDSAKLITVSAPGEVITSFGWSGSNGIVFVGGSETEREVLRYDIEAKTRKSIVQAGSTKHKYSSGGEFRIQEFWSPNGRFLSFVGPDFKSSILDTIDGTIRVIGRGQSGGHQAAWKSDSTGVFVTDSSEPVGAPFEAFFVSTNNWETADLSTWIKENFGSSQTFTSAPLWTADNRFVVMNSNDMGGVLFDPDSKEEIFVGKKLKSQIGCMTPNPHGAYCYPPEISITPIPGWVMAISLCNEYLVDYDAERGLLLNKDHDSYPNTLFMTTITYDGKTTVSLGDLRGRVIVRDVDFSKARQLEELKSDK